MPVTTPLHTNNQKIGSCPHGMPAGACPICNGLSGGNSTTKRDIPRNPGEMTYNECVAMGAMLRAMKQAKQRAQLNEQNRLQFILNFNKGIEKAALKMQQWSEFISKNTPAFIAKPLNFIMNKTLGSMLALIKNLPNMISNIGQKFADIADKLSAIFGEKKNAVSERIAKSLRNLKQKFKSLFFIFGAEETDDEERKIQESKRIFNLKTIIKKLTNRKHKKEKEK